MTKCRIKTTNKQSGIGKTDRHFWGYNEGIEGLTIQKLSNTHKGKVVFTGCYIRGCVGVRRMVCVLAVGYFVHDRVQVCGNHFTCCTDGFHTCVRSCLLTTQNSVLAPSEGCWRMSNSTKSHPTEGTARMWGAVTQLLVLVARNICRQDEINYWPVTWTWNFSNKITFAFIIHWGQFEEIGGFVRQCPPQTYSDVRQISLTQLAMHSTALVVRIQLSALGSVIEYEFFMLFLSPYKQHLKLGNEHLRYNIFKFIVCK